MGRNKNKSRMIKTYQDLLEHHKKDLKIIKENYNASYGIEQRLIWKKRVSEAEKTIEEIQKEIRNNNEGSEDIC